MSDLTPTVYNITIPNQFEATKGTNPKPSSSMTVLPMQVAPCFNSIVTVTLVLPKQSTELPGGGRAGAWEVAPCAGWARRLLGGRAGGARRRLGGGRARERRDLGRGAAALMAPKGGEGERDGEGATGRGRQVAAGQDLQALLSLSDL